MESVLITGGSHGIGAATAILFAENGFSVLLGYDKAERQTTAPSPALRLRADSTLKFLRAELPESAFFFISMGK